MCRKFVLESGNILARFQVLTATSMKVAILWDVVPCSLVDIDGRFRGAYCQMMYT
jgi:hypothetical protein